jgi:hypothetical protein
VVVEEERRELPELVLGVVAFGVEQVKGEVTIEEGKEDVKEGVDAGKGKEVEKTEPEAVTL